MAFSFGSIHYVGASTMSFSSLPPNFWLHPLLGMKLWSATLDRRPATKGGEWLTQMTHLYHRQNQMNPKKHSDNVLRYSLLMFHSILWLLGKRLYWIQIGIRSLPFHYSFPDKSEMKSSVVEKSCNKTQKTKNKIFALCDNIWGIWAC